MNEIAVLIPVYNNIEGLAASLHSITLTPKVTIVIVDDGSSEKLKLSALTPHTKHEIKLITLEVNEGIVAALNAGLKYIYSNDFKYIARLDAGDLMTNDRLSSQVDFLINNLNCMVVGGGARFVNKDGLVVFQYAPPENNALIRKKMHINNCFCHPAVMWKIDGQKKFYYASEYQYAEDYHMFWKMLTEFGGANLNINVVDTLADPNGISRTKRKKQLSLRLKIQMNNFDGYSIYSYIGVVKSILLFLLPVRIIDTLKNFKGISR